MWTATTSSLSPAGCDSVNDCVDYYALIIELYFSLRLSLQAKSAQLLTIVQQHSKQVCFGDKKSVIQLSHDLHFGAFFATISAIQVALQLPVRMM